MKQLLTNHTEATLSQMIERRYAPPEWAYLSQVRNGTGFVRSARTADGLAMSLWPSRGIELHGFEIKVSRSDWLSELRNPQKADDIARYCDRWWLVVADGTIVQKGELPGAWGLYVAKGEKLYCEAQAEKQKAEPIDTLFLAAIFRRIHENVNNTVAMQARYEKGKKEGEQLARRGFDIDIEEARRERDDFKRLIENFETNCGIDIRQYRYEKPEVLGRAFRAAVEMEGHALQWQIKQIRSVRDRLTAILENLKDKDGGLL